MRSFRSKSFVTLCQAHLGIVAGIVKAKVIGGALVAITDTLASRAETSAAEIIGAPGRADIGSGRVVDDVASVAQF